MPIPSLDWYMQREVESVKDGDDGLVLTLSGGIEIRTALKDKAKSFKELKGKTFTTMTMSNGGTILYFGVKDNPTETGVTLDPNEYSIYDERFGNEPIFPQRSRQEAFVPLPDDPSPERVADSPSAVKN